MDSVREKRGLIMAEIEWENNNSQGVNSARQQAGSLMRSGMRSGNRGLMNQVASMLWANQNNSMLLRNGHRDMGGNKMDQETFFRGLPSDAYRVGRGAPKNPCAGK